MTLTKNNRCSTSPIGRSMMESAGSGDLNSLYIVDFEL